MTTLCLPSSSQHDQPHQPPSYCQVCHQACRPLRCTGCQSAWYCSTDCQKVDWKSNDHRKTCAGRRPRGRDVIRTDQTNETTTTSGHTFQATLQELQSLTLGLSLNQAQEEYHKAQDEVKRQVVEKQSKTESKEGGRKSRSSPTMANKTKAKFINGSKIENPADLKHEELRDNSGNENNPKAQRNDKKRQETQPSAAEIDPIDTSIMASNAYFSSVMVEDMSRIARYQVTLKQRQLLPQEQADASRKSVSIRAVDSIDNLDLSTQDVNDKPYQNNTLVTIRSKTNPEANISIQLPRRLITMSSSSPSSSYNNHLHATMDDDGTIQLRLPYQHSGSINHNDDDDDLRMCDVLYEDCPPTFSERRPVTAKIINSLQCRFCGMSLLPQGSVDRVLPLPTGYWDEVADYLICYSGQPTVDFASSSTSAQPGLALQDANVLCLHKDDVRESICILAVQGYGEEANSVTSDWHGEESQPSDFGSTEPGRPTAMEYKDVSATVRGVRSWVEAVGGASICCSQCCSPLGFASIESPVTYRFLKHRLSIGSGLRIPSSPPMPLALSKPTEQDVDFDMVPMSSGASFLARELVRYADAKAIFTFVVVKEEPEHFGAMGHASPSSAGKCLLLRLLSWDTVLASRFESSTSQRLQFNRVAKIVFEETVDKLAATSKGTRHGEDIMNWVWGGVDLCCLPSGQQQQSDEVDNKSNQDQDLSSGIVEQGEAPKRSAVRLQLPAEEWNEVRTSILEGSKWFSKSVSEATIIVKMGPNSSPTVGLSAISL